MGVKAGLVGGAAMAVTAMLCLAGSVAADSDGGTSSTALVEATTCARPSAPPAPPADAEPGSTLVSFGIPNQVRVRVHAGVLVAASTNTGCAPRPDDVVLVEVDGQEPVPATADQVAAALAQFRTGDWRQPGAWHAP